MLVADRTPQQWFEHASRCYVDLHQGCPWCAGVHQVARVQYQNRVTYTCQACDFQASHEAAAHRYFCIPGEDVATRKRATYQI